MKTESPIINADVLLKLIDSTNLILIDASNKKDYKIQHLQGAQYVDLNTQLSEIPADPKNGGRHPLPKIEEFAEIISKLGISHDKHVVVYDRSNGANAAARLWWMLKAFGLENVQVLNGGFKEAKDQGFPVDNKEVKQTATKVSTPKEWKLKLADIKDVSEYIETGEFTLIDVRSPERYSGLHEPIDLVAGHIPNAVNLPYPNNLDPNGLFWNPEKLRAKYLEALNESDLAKVVCYCGSGVTACHTILALTYAGFEIPSLYVGSWSEWSRNNKITEC